MDKNTEIPQKTPLREHLSGLFDRMEEFSNSTLGKIAITKGNMSKFINRLEKTTKGINKTSDDLLKIAYPDEQKQ